MKTAVITGASNGIGRETAIYFAKKGYGVVLADVDESAGSTVKEQIDSAGGKSCFIKTDVSSPEDIVHLMKKSFEIFGSIDVLVNNAGLSKWESPLKLSVEEWDQIINVNLRSVFLCSREAVPYMERSKGGSIVNIASTRAFMSEPNSEAYAATKGGIVALTHALAASLADKFITVNAVSPGWIETTDYEGLREIDHHQHLSGRVGKPVDIAKACYYLSEPDNNFINGENLVIDGGMTRKMIYEEG